MGDTGGSAALRSPCAGCSGKRGRGRRRPQPEWGLPRRLPAGPGGGGLAAGGRAALVWLPVPPGQALPLRDLPVLAACGCGERRRAPHVRAAGALEGSPLSLNFTLNFVTLGAGRSEAELGGSVLGLSRAVAVSVGCWKAGH